MSVETAIHAHQSMAGGYYIQGSFPEFTTLIAVQLHGKNTGITRRL